MPEIYKIALVLGTVAILCIVLSLIAFIRKRRKKRKEDKTSAMIDQMSLRRASINTKYMENDLFNIIQNMVLSKYSLDFRYIPVQSLTQELNSEWYNSLKRECDLGIRKQILNFTMNNPRVVKQDNSSIYAVTKITVEAEFIVDYHYYHPTLEQRYIKQFKQRFDFINANEAWLLGRIHPETETKM